MNKTDEIIEPSSVENKPQKQKELNRIEILQSIQAQSSQQVDLFSKHLKYNLILNFFF